MAEDYTNIKIYNKLKCDFFAYNENERSLNFLYANIRSIRKNFNTFLTEFSQIDNDVHFIVFSEVWIASHELYLYKIPGYNVYGCCNDNYRAGGVVCYVKNNIEASNENIRRMETADNLLLQIKIGKFYCNLLCIYRLQSFSEESFIDELAEILPLIRKNTIYFADGNVNLLNLNSTHTVNYQNIMNCNGYLSLVNVPTRITPTSKTCIDHCFIKCRNVSNYKSAVFDIGLTDHCLLGLKIVDKALSSGLSENANAIIYKNIIDYNLVKQKLCSIKWEDLYEIIDVNQCYNSFYNILNEVINSCTKSIVLKNKLDKARLKSAWITARILRKINKRNKLYRISKRRPYDIEFKNYFTRFSLDLKNEIDKTRNNYYSEQLVNCNGDTARQWRIINSITGGSSVQTIDKIELTDGTVIRGAQNIAEEVNRHLTDIANNISPSVTSVCERPNYIDSFFVNFTDTTEVINIINGLKNKKSSGYDNFNVNLVKCIAEEIANVLTYIINLSFSTGVFPDSLKLSIVVPLLKKPNLLNINNLRPISLISVFSKIIEKIMKTRLIGYLNNISVLSTNQFGFTKGKCTEDALIKVTDYIYSNFNENKKVTGLFIDFKKAFDTVNHSILLNKMESIGIRGVALDWFSSYLSGRRQRVRVAGCLSEALPVARGVPQGAVLSANLFLIFINDLLAQNLNGSVNAFADDVAIFYSDLNTQNLLEKINEDLITVRNWCKLNCMEINVSKTKFVNFALRGFDLPRSLVYHKYNCSSIVCDCQIIEQTATFKYLGVIFDEKLSWEKHIQELNNKIKYSIRKFYYLKNICSEQLMRNLYFALIQSRIQYGLIAWGGTFKYLIEKIRVTQNYLIRIIMNKNARESSFPLFVELKIFPIQHNYIFKVLRLFYNRSGNQGTNELYYNTRNVERLMFRIPKVNKSVFKHSFTYSGPKYFNQLPHEIRSINNQKEFIRKITEWLLRQTDVSFINITNV